MSEKHFVQVGSTIINLQRVSWASITKSGKLTVKLADEENKLLFAGTEAQDLYVFFQIHGLVLSQLPVEWEKPAPVIPDFEDAKRLGYLNEE